MYLKTVAEAKKALCERRSRQPEIQAATESFIQKRYGITGYRGNLKKHLPFLENDNGAPYAALARHIASQSTEEVACEIFCRKAGFSMQTITFERDAFKRANHDKTARVKVPWIWYSKRKRFVIEKQYMALESFRKLESMPLYRIRSKIGGRLTDFHRMLRASVFGTTENISDVSTLHSESLVNADIKPTFAFIDERGHERKVETASLNGELPLCRPPASWYYPLYLSWFLDGHMVLLETYENSERGVPEAKKMFQQSMCEVESETGFKPLVLEIPPLTDERLFCNRHLVGASALLRNGYFVTEYTDTDPTVEILRQIGESVNSFCG